VIVPLLTTLLAYLIGGLVMLVTRKGPDRHLQRVRDGNRGIQWNLPVDPPGAPRTARIARVETSTQR
jgi:hypothetical protein